MDELFAQHATEITRFFRGMVSDEVDDLVQETFLRMQQAQGRMHPNTRPRAFLFGIAWNVLLQHLRRLGRLRAIDPASDSMIDLQPGPTTVALRRHRQRIVANALRRLPIQDQAALQMRYWDELTLHEIADTLGITIPALCRRLKAAQARLATILAELEAQGPLLSGSTP